jgi:ankyrin repeat protein
MAGSSVHIHDIYGDTALHVAAYADENPSLIELLFVAGASVNARNSRSGQVPLNHAACLNHARVAECLLQLGAEVNASNNDHNTPLFEAMRYANAATVEVLLRHGARVDLLNKARQTILHTAATWGDEGCISLLINEGRLRGGQGVDVLARDRNGRSALDCLRNRSGMAQEIVTAMVRLLENLGCQDGRIEEIHDDNETDSEDGEIEFFDALENG